MRLRDRRELPGLDGLHEQLTAPESSQPERVVERHAMRDRIRDAMEELPPNLRLVLMLRHFGDITSYREIAEECEVPVGTVRSRLDQARAKMVDVPVCTAGRAHEDAAALTEESRHEALATPDKVDPCPPTWLDAFATPSSRTVVW